MAATKTSAVADDPIDVLFVLHDGFDLMDFAGPCEVLTAAQHDPQDPNTKAFEITIASAESKVMSDQGVMVESHITFTEAHERIKEFDVMVIVGGNSAATLKAAGEVAVKEGVEPFALIRAYADAQEDDTTRERTLMSICTGSLFLARSGVLAGLACTTHPNHVTKLAIVCSQATKMDMDEPPNVMDNERYVVNNPRFDIAGDGEDDPYVRRKSDAGRRPSAARKGSMSFKNAGRRESITRREEMRLGGLRVITSGGVTAGIDASLYLVSTLVSTETAEAITKEIDHEWRKGAVVDGVDV